jgi:Asp-tRNA(Asn)/Glu-tRNA(Gln) amidotransferase A subunit family amidase
MYLTDVLTCGINPVRIPGLSVPLGLFEVEGTELPTGCQLLGPEKSEDKLFTLGEEIEKLK